MAFGSLFSKFKEFQATTADEKVISIKNNFITRLGFKILGIPHIGIRIRARKIIKNFKNIEFSIADLCSLPFKKESFDEIICSDVLEHIKNDEEALFELARVLKKEGVLLITGPYRSQNKIQTFKKF